MFEFFFLKFEFWKKKIILAIFIHLLKAFDNLDHKELLNKLEIHYTSNINCDPIITTLQKENNSFQLTTKYKLTAKIDLFLKGVKEITCPLFHLNSK